VSRAVVDAVPSADQRRLLHQTIKKVTEDLEGLRFNTAISQMMVFTNDMTKLDRRPRALIEPFVLLLAPFAPHLCEDLWEKLGHRPSTAREPWPAFDPALVVSDRCEIPIQVNGKLRSKIEVPADWTEEQIVALATQDTKLAEWLQGKPPRKVIYVAKKLINFVV
jgi:leucyl-tRNA synthetase